MKHDKAYDQVAHPDAGAHSVPTKEASPNGNPSHFDRTPPGSAVERSDAEQQKCIEVQLGSNGYQSNGFDPCVAQCGDPAPMRGFGNSKADKGGYQGKGK